jgi:hypothetical protein
VGILEALDAGDGVGVVGAQLEDLVIKREGERE